MTSLEFDTELHYEETPAGIMVPIRLTHGNRSVESRARLDTGAADCIFDESYAVILGLTDSGIEREYRTVAGSFKAYGHEVMIETLGLEWTAMVFFHAMGNPAHAFVGRRGWLDRVRLESCITNRDCWSGGTALETPDKSEHGADGRRTYRAHRGRYDSGTLFRCDPKLFDPGSEGRFDVIFAEVKSGRIERLKSLSLALKRFFAAGSPPIL